MSRSLQFWFNKLAFPATTKFEPERTSLSVQTVVTSAILLIAGLLLFSNCNYPLFEPDEARNAQLAINILDSGDWISLTLNGEPYWDKPPFLAWTTAASYRLFGISEFATRLPTIVSGFALIVTVLFMGRRLFGFRTATLGCLALLLAWGFSFQARYVTMDIMLTLFATACTLSVAAGIDSIALGFKRAGRLWLLSAGVSMGLGILVKGPICPVLTLPPLVIWMVLCRGVTRSHFRDLLKFTCLPAAIVALPWFIATAVRSPEFVRYFFWQHHVVRFTDAFNHQEPFWFYLPVLWLFMFPASILMPRVIVFLLGRAKAQKNHRNVRHGLLAISAAWILAFFSLSDCKLPAYVLPAFPMIALLIGSVLNYDLQQAGASGTRFARLPVRIVLGTSSLVVVLLILNRYWSGNFELLAIFIAGVLMAFSFHLVLKRRTSNQALPWLATAVVGILFVHQGVDVLVPTIAHRRSILASIAQDRKATPNSKLVFFGRDPHATSMYLPEVEVVRFSENDTDAFFRFLESERTIDVIASDRCIDLIRETGSSIQIEPLEIRHAFQIRVMPTRFAEENSFQNERDLH